MTPQDFEKALRAFWKRTRIRPFIVSLVNGDRVEVDHPEALIRRGGTAVLMSADDIPTLFDNESVSELSGEPAATRAG